MLAYNITHRKTAAYGAHEMTDPVCQSLSVERNRAKLTYGDRTQQKPVSLKLSFANLPENLTKLFITGVSQIANNGSFRDGTKLSLTVDLSFKELVSLNAMISEEMAQRYAKAFKSVATEREAKEIAQKELIKLKKSISELKSLAVD